MNLNIILLMASSSVLEPKPLPLQQTDKAEGKGIQTEKILVWEKIIPQQIFKSNSVLLLQFHQKPHSEETVVKNSKQVFEFLLLDKEKGVVGADS